MEGAHNVQLALCHALCMTRLWVQVSSQGWGQFVGEEGVRRGRLRGVEWNVRSTAQPDALVASTPLLALTGVTFSPPQTCVEDAVPHNQVGYVPWPGIPDQA